MSKRNRNVILQPTERPKVTRKSLEDAAADARHLMGESPVVRSLVGVDIVARQLFLLVRQGLEHELTDGWEIENPNLVIHILGQSAQEKSVADPCPPTALRQALLEMVLPVIDIFCQMEREKEPVASSSVSSDSGGQAVSVAAEGDVAAAEG